MDLRHPFKNEPVFTGIAVAGAAAVGAKFGFNVDSNLILQVMGAGAIPAAVAIRSNVSPAYPAEPKAKEITVTKTVTNEQPVTVTTENLSNKPVEYDPLGRAITAESIRLNQISADKLDRPI